MNGRRCDGPKLKGPRVVIERGSEGYPSAFEVVRNPPEKLYVLGDPSSLVEGLAVVGARKATPYGLGCAERFSAMAARRGVVILSGGARGCDAQAHRAALAAGCPTVAFLGGGCDQLYPAEHAGLFQKIVDGGGAVVSEHPWDCPPLPYAFRERNRLIAGLARATLIVEAGLPSGTFSTADEALAANREVLVVPGAITSTSSRGANRLIYQGATPIVDDESFQDALFSLFGVLRQEEVVGASGGNVGAGHHLAKAGAKSKIRVGTGAQVGGKAHVHAGAGPAVREVGRARSRADSGVNACAAVRSGADSETGAKATDVQVKGGNWDGIVAALQAEPLGLEELHDLARRLHPKEDAHGWLMERLVEAEASGSIARYPDGRWGPAA